jgi:hypothetical protein
MITDSSVMVLDTTNGTQVKFFKEDPRFAKAVEAIVSGSPEDAFKFDTKTVIKTFFEVDEDSYDGEVTVTIEDGVGYVYIHEVQLKTELHSALTNKIVKMAEQGFDSAPIVNFISNLYANPSKTAVDELFLFIEASELPITEDGYFIAYKIVQNDYRDIYSKTMDNSIGNVLAMPRNMVDDNRANTCSHGLHFCSRGYLNAYGSSSRSDDRCLLVKINPADVVSIPSDYNNAKGRTWCYEVIGEVEGDWRATLPQQDYTSDAVVSSIGEELDDDGDDWYDDDDGDEYDCSACDEEDCGCCDAEESSAQPYVATVEPKFEYSNQYEQGYLKGYRDGSNGQQTSTAGSDDIYDDGYELGFKHGKGHKRKLYK